MVNSFYDNISLKALGNVMAQSLIIGSRNLKIE